jgi:ATP-dependent helicase/DNAse subunit B
LNKQVAELQADKLKLSIRAGEKNNARLTREDIEYLLPQKFSFSQLNSFKHCPYHYWLEYILKIPQKGKSFFSFGTSIHSTLQQFFLLVLQRSQSNQQDLFGQVKYRQAKGQWSVWRSCSKFISKNGLTIGILAVRIMMIIKLREFK